MIQNNTERTGWRDQQISARHRLYGSNVPAVDIDFLLIEYDRSQPKALIEYKHMNSYLGDDVDLNHPNYRAIANLANGFSQVNLVGQLQPAPLPFYIVRYDFDPWWYRILPGNEAARQQSQLDGWVNVTEVEYVSWLHRLRGRNVIEPMFQFDNVKPWEN